MLPALSNPMRLIDVPASCSKYLGFPHPHNSCSLHVFLISIVFVHSHWFLHSLATPSSTSQNQKNLNKSTSTISITLTEVQCSNQPIKRTPFSGIIKRQPTTSLDLCSQRSPSASKITFGLYVNRNPTVEFDLHITW
jgi:hypothetical protein